MSQPTTKKYSAEFKERAVKLAVESEQPIAQTARDLGVNETLQRHFSAMAKFAHVESRFCGHRRRGKAAFDVPVNPCVRSVCSRSVAVGLTALFNHCITHGCFLSLQECVSEPALGARSVHHVIAARPLVPPGAQGALPPAPPTLGDLMRLGECWGREILRELTREIHLQF